MDFTKCDWEQVGRQLAEVVDKWGASGQFGAYQGDRELFCFTSGYKNALDGQEQRRSDRHLMSICVPALLALCIGKLADDGKLSLDDKLAMYIPEYSHAGEVTLRNMLRYESGIPDWYGLYTARAAKGEEASALSQEERFVKERVAQTRGLPFSNALAIVNELELDFPPGAELDESATDTVFLAEVIERVSGIELFEYMESIIFKPLGMGVKPYAEGEDVCSSTAVYACSQLLPIPNAEGLNLASYSYDDMALLMQGIVSQRIVSKNMWRELLKKNSHNIAAGFMDLNGLWSVELGEYCFGFQRWLRFSQKYGFCWIAMPNGDSVDRMEDGMWVYLLRDMKEILDSAVTYPVAPKLVPYNKTNANAAMTIRLKQEQFQFVASPMCCLSRRLANKHMRAFVLQDEGNVIGLSILEANRETKNYFVSYLMIDRRYQNRGYGKYLLKYSMEYLQKKGAKKLEIGVNRRNAAAQALYKSMGFSVQRVYDEGMLMVKRLSDERS